LKNSCQFHAFQKQGLVLRIDYWASAVALVSLKLSVEIIDLAWKKICYN